MPIPASTIVEVQPRVIVGGQSELELNGLLLISADEVPYPAGVLEFASAADVAKYFGSESVAAKFATQYFLGYVNKFRAPSRLYVGASAAMSGATHSWLRGTKPASLSELKKITSGTLNVSVGGEIVKLTALDFSTATTYSDIASKLSTGNESKFTAAYDARGFFKLTAVATGETELAITEDTPAAMALGLGGGTDIVSAGQLQQTFPEVMQMVLNTTQNFVTFTTDMPFDVTLGGSAPASIESEDTPAPASAYADTVYLGAECAKWASSNWGYVYVGYAYNQTAPKSAAQVANSPALQEIVDNNYDNAALVYGNIFYAAFIMGSVASIDWNRTQGVITLAFRSGNNLAATITDSADKTTLDGVNVNYYGKFATRNADFDFLYPGKLLASNYTFIDPLVNAIWLNNHLQVGIMNGLIQSPRVPYTERGYTLIRAWMMDSITKALINGTIDTGVELSQTQKEEVAFEAGLDISDELYTQGYYLQILDPGAEVRAVRGTPICNLWYCYAGSVQRIIVDSTAIL